MEHKDNNVAKGIDHRKSPRASYYFDIYYPHINNKWESENEGNDSPVIRTLNVSDSGIMFLSKVPLKIDDWISFLIRVGDHPSFNCLAQVKWVESDGFSYTVGCQFFTLTSEQIKIIREYVK